MTELGKTENYWSKGWLLSHLAKEEHDWKIVKMGPPSASCIVECLEKVVVLERMFVQERAPVSPPQACLESNRRRMEKSKEGVFGRDEPGDNQEQVQGNRTPALQLPCKEGGRSWESTGERRLQCHSGATVESSLLSDTGGACRELV